MRPEVEYDPNDFNRQKQRQLDSALLVKYFYKSVPDKQASLAEKRPMYKEQLYIDIRVPGDRDSVACRPASAQDIERFRVQYDNFMARSGPAKEPGMPLTEWTQVTRSQAEELAFFGVKTVENLAAVPDSSLQNVRGFMMLKQKAQRWLEENKGKAELEAQKAELEAKLAERDARLSALEEKLASLEIPVKNKGGRPKKVVDDGSTDSDS